jgi:hypothetical protein
MPSDPLILSYLDHMKTTLATMSKDEGYHYDYGAVEEDKDIDWDGTPDLERPPIIVVWQGEADQDAYQGGETAARRFRHWDRFLISVPIKDAGGEHSRRAMRVRADIHAALIEESGRSRGSNGRVLTGDSGSAYAGNEDGGILQLTYHIRWDHVIADHSTGG